MLLSLQQEPDPIREAAGLPVGKQGDFVVNDTGGNIFGDDGASSVTDHNRPPEGQPGLWCQWVPNEDGTAKLAFSSSLGAWGVPVNEKNDVARVDAKKETSDKDVDQLTVSIEKGAGGGGAIKLQWEKAVYAVTFTVKK